MVLSILEISNKDIVMGMEFGHPQGKRISIRAITCWIENMDMESTQNQMGKFIRVHISRMYAQEKASSTKMGS